MTHQETARAYEQGITEGGRFGKHDLEKGLGVTHEGIEGGRENIRTCVYRSTRAFHVGWLRGYRDSVRTLRAGRWGT